MPAYCTDGQLRRAWKNLHEDTEYSVLADLRTRAMNTIDGWLGTVYEVPFNPWLHVSGVAGSDLTIDLEDVGFLLVGDTIGFYDNSAQAMGEVVGTVTGISGATVAFSGLTGVAAGDEVAVYGDVTIRSRTRRVYGPPPEAHARAVDIARYYGHTDISTLQDATDPVVKAYESAVEWGTLLRAGTADLTGVVARTVGYLSTYDVEPAINVDSPTTWGFDKNHPARAGTADRDSGLDN